VRLVVDY